MRTQRPRMHLFHHAPLTHRSFFEYTIPLQEVFSRTSPARRYRTAMVRHSAEDLEIRLEIFAERHDARNVAAAVAVIRCRPDCDDVLGGEVIFVAFVD